MINEEFYSKSYPSICLSNENPYLVRDVHTLHPQKLNARIYDHRVVGPVILPEKITEEMYLQLLKDIIDPALTDILEQKYFFNGNDVAFQQDGTPSHYTFAVREYFNDTFPGRWIGQSRPTGSVDQPASLGDVCQRIIGNCRNITPKTF